MPSLADKYRPTRLEDLAGQDTAVQQVRAVLARGWGGRAWWLCGPSGAGKSSLARIIAAVGADDLATEEVDAQWLTPARVRELEEGMRYRHLGQKPGKSVICNESHGLRRDTIRLLLTLLERLPDHVCFIFTTTKQGEQRLFDDDVSGDAAPLLSRCIEVTLATDTKAFAERAKAVAMAEGIDGLPLSVYESAVAAGGGNLRRVLQRIESGAFKADARAEMQEQVKALERDYEMCRSTKGEAAALRRAALEVSKAALVASIANLK